MQLIGMFGRHTRKALLKNRAHFTMLAQFHEAACNFNVGVRGMRISSQGLLRFRERFSPELALLSLGFRDLLIVNLVDGRSHAVHWDLLKIGRPGFLRPGNQSLCSSNLFQATLSHPDIFPARSERSADLAKWPEYKLQN